MWKTILAGTAAVAIAGTSIVYAQQQQGPERAHERWRPSQEDVAAFTDARIAALTAGLELTAEQEKNWPGFEAALRDIAKARAERAVAHRDEPRPTDPVERLRRQAETLTTAGAALKRLADAQDPLYKSLDDNQKNRFRMLSHLLAPRHMRFTEMRGRRDHGWRGHPHPRDYDGSRGGYRL